MDSHIYIQRRDIEEKAGMVGGARKRVMIECSTKQYDEYAVTTPNNENATSERNARRKGKEIAELARKIGC